MVAVLHLAKLVGAWPLGQTWYLKYTFDYYNQEIMLISAGSTKIKTRALLGVAYAPDLYVVTLEIR
jgi:hypothetical protein